MLHIIVIAYWNKMYVTMPWHVVGVLRLGEVHAQILPSGEFCLENEHKIKINACGWLPCHHGNVEYDLVIKKNGDITSLEWMRMRRPKKRAPVTAAAKKIAAGRLAPLGYTREQYLQQAEHAYRDQATWTIAIMYPYKRIVHMNLRAVFACLTADPESICRRGSVACQSFLMYNESKAWAAVEKCLKTLDEPPYDDREGFLERMRWQIKTRYNTGSLENPGDAIHGVQKYQNIWTTLDDIQQARTIRNGMTREKCRLWLGTPCHAALDGKRAVVNTLEEAFALKCFVNVDIYMLQPPYDEEYRTEMGLPCIQTLGMDEDVCIPWAHLWGVEEWLQLLQMSPRSFTCIGRLDQYARGRGQVFRQMIDAKFPCDIGHHYKMNDVEMINTEDVANFVHGLQFPTVQCFADHTNQKYTIDTGRRWIMYPRRIRTVTQRPSVKPPRVALQEEHFTHEYKIGNNASVVHVDQILTPVDVGVYLCSEETRPFDIHVARTLCRHKLYVVNCVQVPFAWEHRAPARIAVSPFL